MRNVVGLLVALVPSLMLGATLQVDDDWSHCHSANFRSIAAAIAGSTPGDVVEVCPGRYEESLTIPHALTVRGWGPASELRTGDPATESVLVQRVGEGLTIGASGVRIEGFTFQSAPGATRAAQLRTLPSVSGSLIVGNAFLEAWIAIELYNRDVAVPASVEGNWFHHCETDINARVQGAVISRNSVTSWTNGIQALDSADVTLSNNVARFSDGGAAITVFRSTRVRVTGNHISRLERFGITIASSSEVEVLGNTFDDFLYDGTGILLRQVRASRVINNAVLGNPASGSETYAGIVLVDSTNIDIWGNVVDEINLFGIELINSSRNRIIGNKLTRNDEDGIRLGATSVDNLILANELMGNTVYDAHDQAPGRNWWLANECVSDNPTGTICR